MSVEYDIVVMKEGETYIAYSPELDISSCGNTVEEANKKLKIAVRLFLEEAEKIGTLENILIESGYNQDKTNRWTGPKVVATELAEVR